jgi:NAD-dependent deacetylase
VVSVQPNPAHRALAGMERRYLDFLLVTQNVDDLHERAGSKKLIKLHGSLMETRCTGCDTVRPLERPLPAASVTAEWLPRCACGGLLRPNVVWFGEALDSLHFARIQGFFRRCPPPLGEGGGDLLLIIGTSGEVGGGYGIAELARRYDARVVEINPEPSELSRQADLVVREPAGRLLARVWPRVLAAAGPREG